MSKLDEPNISPTIYTSLNSLVMNGIEIDKNLRQPNFYSCINYNELKFEVFGIITDLLTNQKVPMWLSQRIAWFYAEKCLEDIVNDLTELKNTSNEIENIDYVDCTEPKTFKRDKIVTYLRNIISKIIKEWQIKKSSQIKQNLLFSFARFEQEFNNFNYSEFGIKNKRRVMEDKIAIIENVEMFQQSLSGNIYNNSIFDTSRSKRPTALFGVFDGHCGIDCSQYISKHLPMYIIQHPDFNKSNDNHVIALEEGFKIINEKFSEKARTESLRSGSTACVAILGSNNENSNLFNTLDVAWCGDTCLGLFKNGELTFITDEHKPDNDFEKARIIKAGGNVSFVSNCWRVDGSLAVSRSFGDIDYQPSVISDPQITHIELDGTEDYLLIGCDGLWETLDKNEISSIVYEYISTSDNLNLNIAEFLVRKAQQNGSMDNITAIFVLLKENLSQITKPF